MIINKYFDFLKNKLEEVATHETANIEQAANLVVESCVQGKRFYVFGSGHSHLIAEELYIRAGGLALVKAILPPELMLHEMPNKSTLLERLDGYAAALLDLHKVEAGDTILVVSNSGRNNVPVEMCMEAKKRGLHVIVMCSMKHASQTTSRHSSGKKMYEFADVILDNHGEKGDAAFELDGLDTPVGPTSDFIGIAIAQALLTEVIDQLVKTGMEVPVFKSSNVDGADAFNQKLFDQYYGYWK